MVAVRRVQKLCCRGVWVSEVVADCYGGCTIAARHTAACRREYRFAQRNGGRDGLLRKVEMLSADARSSFCRSVLDDDMVVGPHHGGPPGDVRFRRRGGPSRLSEGPSPARATGVPSDSYQGSVVDLLCFDWVLMQTTSCRMWARASTRSQERVWRVSDTRRDDVSLRTHRCYVSLTTA